MIKARIEVNAYNISELAEMLGKDRRTVTKMVKHIAPVHEIPQNGRTIRFYTLRDVMFAASLDQ